MLRRYILRGNSLLVKSFDMATTVEAKIVTLGSEGVGKTSLIMRQVGNMLPRSISPTIGASFFTFSMYIQEKRLKIQLWDTAGQERFRAMAPLYYRKCNAALIVYDITNMSTFQDAKDWIKEIKERAENPIVLVLVGNKTDLEAQREVSVQEADDYVASIGGKHLQSSAVTGQGVKDIFLQAAQDLSDFYDNNMLTRSGDPTVSFTEFQSPVNTPPSIPQTSGHTPHSSLSSKNNGRKQGNRQDSTCYC